MKRNKNIPSLQEIWKLEGTIKNLHFFPIVLQASTGKTLWGKEYRKFRKSTKIYLFKIYLLVHFLSSMSTKKGCFESSKFVNCSPLMDIGKTFFSIYQIGPKVVV